MPSCVRLLFVGALVAVMLAGPWWYLSLNDTRYRNFHVVRAGTLYRSGQLDVVGLRQIVRQHGIKTIVSLRADDTDSARQEEAWARDAGINYVRIPPRAWSRVNDAIPAEQGLAAFRAVMDDPACHPVLVHCFKGVHRTGAHCAIYRMDYEGWSNREALAEMRLMGYDTLDDDRDVFGYLATYRPRGSAVSRGP